MKTPHPFLFAGAAWFLATCGLWAQGDVDADPLESALQAIEAKIELHDWLGLLDMADPEHRNAKISDNVSHAAFLAGLLGLNHEGNSLAGKHGLIRQAELSQIRQVEWKRRKPLSAGKTTMVLGTATLHEGEVLVLEIHLTKHGAGYLLTGGGEG